MGIGSQVNSAVQQQLPTQRPPQSMGGKGGAAGPTQPSLQRPEPLQQQPTQGGSQSAFPQPMGGKGGAAGPQQPMQQQPQPMGGKGGAAGPNQQQYQRYLNKQNDLQNDMARFQQRRFGELTPDNMQQYQDAVQNRFGNRMDRLEQRGQRFANMQQPMQQPPQQMGGKGSVMAPNQVQQPMQQQAMQQVPMGNYQDQNALSGLAALAQRQGMM